MLLSGLNLGSSWCDQLSIEMLVDYITGQLGGDNVSETTPINSTVCLCMFIGPPDVLGYHSGDHSRRLNHR